MGKRIQTSRDRIVLVLLIAAVCVALGIAMTFANPFTGAPAVSSGSAENISVRLEARVNDDPVDNGTEQEPVKVQVGDVITYDFFIENSGDPYFAVNDVNVVDVWATRHNAFAVSDTGDFWVWGEGVALLGIGKGEGYKGSRYPIKNPYLSPSSDQSILADGEYVVEMHTTHTGAIAITNHNNIYSWGSTTEWYAPSRGILGNSVDGTTTFDVPVLAYRLNGFDFQDIYLFNGFGMGVTPDKSLYLWGNNITSNSTEPGGNLALDPVLIPELSPTSAQSLIGADDFVIDIVQGLGIAIAQTNAGDFYVISNGKGDYGNGYNSEFYSKQAGVGQVALDETVIKHPFLSPDSPDFVLESGNYFTRVINIHTYPYNFSTAGFIALTNTGQVYAWGSDGPNWTTPWHRILINSNVPVHAEIWSEELSGDVVDIISSAWGGNLPFVEYVVTSTGNVYEYGYNYDDIGGEPSPIQGFRLNEELSGTGFDKIIPFQATPLGYVLKDGSIYQSGRVIRGDWETFEYLDNVERERWPQELTELLFLRIEPGDNFEIKLDNIHTMDKRVFLDGVPFELYNYWGHGDIQRALYEIDIELTPGGPGTTHDVSYHAARLPNGEVMFRVTFTVQSEGDFVRTFQLIDHTTGEVHETNPAYHSTQSDDDADRHKFAIMFTDAQGNALRDAVILGLDTHEVIDFAEYLGDENFIPGYEYAGLMKGFEGDWMPASLEELLPITSLEQVIIAMWPGMTFQFQRNSWHEVQISFQDIAGADIALPVMQYYPHNGDLRLSSTDWADKSEELVATHYSLDGGQNWDPFWGADVVSIDVTRDMHVIVRFAADEEPWEPAEIDLGFDIGKILMLTEGTRLGSNSTFSFRFNQVTPDHPAYDVWSRSGDRSATSQHAQIDSMSASFSPRSTVRFAPHETAEAYYAYHSQKVNPLVLIDEPSYDEPYVFLVWEEISDDPDVDYYPLAYFLSVSVMEVDGKPVLNYQGSDVVEGFAVTPGHTLNPYEYLQNIVEQGLEAIVIDFETNTSVNFDNLLFFINQTPGVDDIVSDGQLELTKTLRMNEGTVWDGREDFLFEIEGLASNGNAEVAPPAVASPVALSMDDAVSATAGGVTELVKTINLFEGVTFERSGVFTYRVSEVRGDIQTMTYDETIYEVEVYVRMVNGSAEVDSVTVFIVEGADRDKVDTLEFVNEFYEVTDFTITKVVSGDYADLSRGFDIRATLIPTPIWNDYLDDVMSSGQWTWDEIEGVWFIEAPVSDGFTVTTARSLPVGAAVTITEADYSADGYTTWINGTQTQSATLILAADDANLFAIENIHQMLAPTGVLTGSVPWIVLATLVIGVLYASSRRRRNAFDDTSF